MRKNRLNLVGVEEPLACSVATKLWKSQARIFQTGSRKRGRNRFFEAMIAFAVWAPPFLYSQAIDTANITALQTAVTASPGTTQNVPGSGSGGFSSSTTFTINYAGEITSITGLTVGSTAYNPQPFNGPVTTSLIRVPNPSLPNNNNIIYSRVTSSSGNTRNLAGPFEGNEQAAFNANNLNHGTDNLFQNQGDANNNNNNIERVDVVFRRGLLAHPALFFSVFERGATGGHDPFKIAAITSINAQGSPAGYGALLGFGPGSSFGSYGTTDLVASTNYLVLRNLVTNQGGLATSPSALVNQPIGGIAISATGLVTANGLGATPGTVIYGYSLFAPDVTGTGGQVLTNPSTFPLNTTNGGIDLIGYTGVVFQAIVPVIEIPTLIIPDGVDIVIPPNLVITTGDIDVPSGTGAITDGSITTPQDLNFNGGNGATLISNTPLNAGGDANINGGTLELQDNLTAGGNVNVNPGSSLVIAPPGSLNAGGDVNVTDATVISSGQLNSQGSLNLNPGSSLVVDPTGSVNAGGDVNLNNSMAIVQGDLGAGGSINIGPGSGFVVDPMGTVNAGDSLQVADDAALIVDGQLTTPTTSILNGGGLAGTGVINGNVNNSGVVVPGDPISNSTGTFTINGNYTQNQNGTLQINANSTEDFSKVVVNGDATIGGTLAVVPLNGFKPQFGQQLPSFLEANNVNGNFSNIEMPPGFRGRVEEDDGALTLTFAPVSYTQVAQNQNQANVAAALDGFIPATSGDRLVVSTALDHLSASEYPGAFDEILPAFYQTVSEIGLSLVNTQSQLIDQRLDAIRLGADRGLSVQGLGKIVPVYKETDGKSVADGKSRLEKNVVTPTLEDTHWGVWVMGSGIFGRSYSVENLPNYRYSSGQFLVGADHRWNRYFSTGLFAGYQGAYATYPESERVWMNGATFGVYATFDARNGFYASTIVSGSYSNYSTRRSIEFDTIDRTARGDLDSGSVGTFLKLGYDFKVGGFTFGPVLSAQYTYLGVAPFTESGADSLNLRVGQQNLNSLQLNVGGRLAYTWSLAEGNILLIPQVRMFWNHEFLQNSTSIWSNLDGGAGPGFNYRTINPSRDSVFAGAGLIAQLGRNWNASVYYNTDFGSATSNTHIVSASAGFLW